MSDTEEFDIKQLEKKLFKLREEEKRVDLQYRKLKVRVILKEIQEVTERVQCKKKMIVELEKRESSTESTTQRNYPSTSGQTPQQQRMKTRTSVEKGQTEETDSTKRKRDSREGAPGTSGTKYKTPKIVLTEKRTPERVDSQRESSPEETPPRKEEIRKRALEMKDKREALREKWKEQKRRQRQRKKDQQLEEERIKKLNRRKVIPFKDRKEKLDRIKENQAAAAEMSRKRTSSASELAIAESDSDESDKENDKPAESPRDKKLASESGKAERNKGRVPIVKIEKVNLPIKIVKRNDQGDSAGLPGGSMQQQEQLQELPIQETEKDDEGETMPEQQKEAAEEPVEPTAEKNRVGPNGSGGIITSPTKESVISCSKEDEQDRHNRTDDEKAKQHSPNEEKEINPDITDEDNKENHQVRDDGEDAGKMEPALAQPDKGL